MRKLRVRARLSQTDLAAQTDMSGGLVSQIETGRTSVPPERYEVLADVLKVPPRVFAETMVRYSNPWAYLMVFGRELPAATVERLKVEAKRLAAPAGRKPRRRKPRPHSAKSSTRGPRDPHANRKD